MKAHTVSLINSLVLVTMGLWGYLDSDSRPITALIPVIVGVILLIINSGVKKENKIAAHIAVLLTLLIIIGLVRPFLGVDNFVLFFNFSVKFNINIHVFSFNYVTVVDCH